MAQETETKLFKLGKTSPKGTPAVPDSSVFFGHGEEFSYTAGQIEEGFPSC
jgi:hypothetical protein